MFLRFLPLLTRSVLELSGSLDVLRCVLTELCLLNHNEANNLGIPMSKWFGLSGTRMTDKSFNDIEPLLALRSTIVQLFEPHDPTHLLLVADMTRQGHPFSYASSIINRLSSSESYKESMSLWLAEHCRLLWTREEQDSAINIANLLLSHLEEKRVRGHSVHGTIGRWLTKSQFCFYCSRTWRRMTSVRHTVPCPSSTTPPTRT